MTKRLRPKIFASDQLFKNISIDAIQHVSPEWMVGRQARMVEITGSIMLQSDLLHYAARTDVGWDGERDELGKLEDRKGVLQNCRSSLRRQTTIPKRPSEAPSDFDGGTEGCFKPHIGNPDEPDEGRYSNQFGSKEAESMLPVMSLDPSRHVIALFTAQA